MLKNLEIQDFRGFHRFRVPRLGRVNLLVGTNNSGKTSVLEAIDILTARGRFAPVWDALRRRGEVFRNDSGASHVAEPNGDEADVRRLFRGHTLARGSRFVVSGDTDRGKSIVSSTVEDTGLEPRAPNGGPRLSSEPDPRDLKLALAWNRGDALRREMFDLTPRMGVKPNSWALHRPRDRAEGDRGYFLTASSLSSADVAAMFDQIVLTPGEDMVLDAMRLIDPGIDRVAVSRSEIDFFAQGDGSKGGILLRLKGFDDRVPIGSMGDGVWRLLGLALVAAQSDGGVLLVDEIDTGLHYTVLHKLWRFLHQVAKNNDVQVVATTHSWDCCRALAAICREGVSKDSDVTISRIEKDREEAVTYSEQEIVAVAEHDIEVR